MTGILSRFSYYSLLTQEGSNVPLKWYVLRNLCLTKLIYKLLFLYKFRAKTRFWTEWDRYNMKWLPKCQTGQRANDRH